MNWLYLPLSLSCQAPENLKAIGITKLRELLGPNTEFKLFFVLPPGRSLKVPVTEEGELPDGVKLQQYVVAYERRVLKASLLGCNRCASWIYAIMRCCQLRGDV